MRMVNEHPPGIDRLFNFFMNSVADRREEERATRERYEKKVSPEETWDEIITRIRKKAQEMNRAK